jgi:5-methylcytosine-specific restriction endonuclease McrA
MYQAGSRRTRIPDTVRFDVLRRDEFACRYCGFMPDEGAELTVDHVVAVSKGGALTSMDNLITACQRCNNGKADQDVEPWEIPPPRGHGSATEDGADG